MIQVTTEHGETMAQIRILNCQLQMVERLCRSGSSPNDCSGDRWYLAPISIAICQRLSYSYFINSIERSWEALNISEIYKHISEEYLERSDLQKIKEIIYQAKQKFYSTFLRNGPAVTTCTKCGQVLTGTVAEHFKERHQSLVCVSNEL